MTTTYSSKKGKKKGPRAPKPTFCKHIIDTRHFPTESVRDFLVGRCIRCECLVASMQVKA